MGGTIEIEWIREGVGFAPPAAAAVRRLEVRNGRIRWNSTFRDPVLQLRMYHAWNAYANGTGPYPGHSRALHPDESAHCQGLAGDTDAWSFPGFLGLAAEYGLIQTAANDPTERHHLEYQWWRDQHRNEPAPAGDNAVPIEPVIVPEEEDDDMPKNTGISWTRSTDSVPMAAVLNTESGFFSAWSHGSGEYNTAVARAFDVDNDFAAVSESHAGAMERACQLVRSDNESVPVAVIPPKA